MRNRLVAFLLSILLTTSSFFVVRPISASLLDLQVTVEAEKTDYVPGEAVNVTILLSNTGRETVTLNFPTDCQASFIVQDSNGLTVYDHRPHQTCYPMPTIVLLPGQTYPFVETWTQVDESGQQVIVPQTFTIFGMILSEEPIPAGSVDISVKVVTSDLQATSLTFSRNFAYSQVISRSISAEATITNQGEAVETVTVSLRADKALQTTQTLTIGPGQTLSLSFPWSAHLLPWGNYSMSIQLSTTTEVGILFVAGLFNMRYPGDVKSDCKINILDLVSVGSSFFSTPSSPGWNPYADINNDLIVNILDLVAVGSNFFKSCPTNADITLGSDPNNRQQVEPTVAIHPLKPNIVVAGAQDLRLVSQGGNRWHGYYRSMDGGLTWSVSLLPGYPGDDSPEGLASPLRGSIFTTDPVLVVDRMGNVFYIGIAATRESPTSSGILAAFVARYVDDGATYHSARFIRPLVSGSFDDKPWISVDNTGGPNDGNLYVVWDGWSEGGSGTFTSLFSMSADHGATFSPPVRVPSSTRGYLPYVTLDPSGNIYVSSLDENITSIQVSRSTDGGFAFTTVVAAPGITANPGVLPGNGFRTFTIPQMAADANGVYLVWDDFRTGDSDVLLSRSTDGGDTWNAPVRVNDVASGQQFFGAIGSSEGGIDVAFYDSRLDDGGTISSLDLFLSRSLDGGLSFLPSSRVTSRSFDPNLVIRTVAPDAGFPFIGDYIQVASTTSAALVVWADNRNVNFSGNPDTGRLDQDVFFSRVTF